MNGALTRCRGALLAVVVLFVWACSARAQETPQRHALLVGVDYGTSQHLALLRHPPAEMHDLADILPLVGFGKTNVTLLSSDSKREGAKAPTVTALREALANLTRNRKKEDVVLLAFSGHLVQFRNGDCYLCGSDSKPNDKATLLPLSEVYAALKACQAGTRIVLLDGCRKNSATQGADALQQVPHPQDVSPPRGVSVLFAGSAGEVSSERTDHIQGYFYQAAIEAMLGSQGLEQNGRVSVQDLERYVCRRVATLTASSAQQTPELLGSRRGDVTEVPLDTRSGLGASFGPVDPQTAYKWNVPHGRPQMQLTVAGSTARKAGLQPGTVVLEIDGIDVALVPDLVQLLGQKKIGDEVKLTVVVEGQRQTRTVRLQRLPSRVVWSAQVRQMAAEGNIEAMSQSGYDYLDGHNVKRDDAEAVKWFKRAANGGHSGAQAKLGYLYSVGQGVPRDLVLARDWLDKAIKQENADAYVTLASMHLNGEGATRSDTEAYRCYRKSADQTNKIGQYNVGLMLLLGRGVSKDATEGTAWIRKSANQGYTTAQLKLGELYADGLEVPRDAAESNRWYRKALEAVRVAAEAGDSENMVELGNMYLYAQGTSSDANEAVKWYRRAADLNNRRAWYQMGLCYQQGYSVKQDHSEASRWYRKAAEAGSITGQFALGSLYFDGLGVTKDRKEAATWYRKSALQGFERAQFMLGWLYHHGEGVDLDYSEAARWYKLAVQQGNASAMNNLARLHHAGLGGLEKDSKEAFRLYLLSANRGVSIAKFHVATCYNQGDGVPKNVTSAIEWYQKAIADGEVMAMNDLAILYDNGMDVTKNPTEAIRLYKMAAAKNYATSMFNLGNMYQHGRGIPVDKKAAREWFNKAAALGYAEAKVRLKELDNETSKESEPTIIGD